MTTTRQLFLQHLAQTSDFPLALEIERAEGVFLYGTNGKKYLDLISGIGVSSVGHCHPKIVEAIKSQTEKYLHLMVYGEYIQSPQVLLAKALADTLPTALNNCYFTNSGTEATEGAMKLAKRFTERSEIISFHNAYHGSTQGSLSLTGGEHFRRHFRPLLPDIKRIKYNEFAGLEHITKRTAAVFAETIQGEAGIIIPEVTYLQALRERCTQTGTLLVLDECQTGFGRTGSFWAFEQFGIVPDILTSAKGMAGGMPLGVFIASEKIMSVLKNNPILGHITTFGGHPVSCAASLATLHVIQAEKLIESVARKEKLFRQLLVHSQIKEIRSFGLMIAVEFENFEILKAVIDRAILRGVISDWFLYCDNSMRIAPPLTISEDEIRWACQVIIEAIGEQK